MTIKEIIEQLGGPIEVARTCGVTPAAVNNWTAQQYVPNRHHSTLIKRARNRRLKISVQALDPHGFAT